MDKQLKFVKKDDGSMEFSLNGGIDGNFNIGSKVKVGGGLSVNTTASSNADAATYKGNVNIGSDIQVDGPIDINTNNQPTNSTATPVTFQVEDKKIVASKGKLVVASPVFAGMLKNVIPEKAIPISGKAKPFQIMIHFVESGKTDALDKEAVDLLVLSNRYKLVQLKNKLESILVDKVQAENAIQLLRLADVNGAEKLKQVTVDYIKKSKALQDSDDLKKLLSERMELYAEFN